MKLPDISIAPLLDRFTALSVRQKVLLFVGTVLVLAGGFYFLIYQEQADKIKIVETNIAEQEKRLAALKQIEAQLPKVQEELAKSEADFSELLKLLPDQKEIPALLETISQLGAQVGLENILFQPQPEQAREFYAAIPIRLDLIGTYHRLGAFLDGISRLDRILKVDTMSITRQPNSSVLRVMCNIFTYRFLEKPQDTQQPKGK